MTARGSKLSTGLSASDTGAELPAGSACSCFTPINPTSSKDQSASDSPQVAPSHQEPYNSSAALPHSTTIKGSTKRGENVARLRPNEKSSTQSKRVSINERFCWNIGFWFEQRMGPDFITDYTRLEQLAKSLIRNAETFASKAVDEQAKLQPDKPVVSVAEYRSLRARIIIGFAMIYEHNLRGSILNDTDQTHPACRPDKSRFKYINMGCTQAQMIGYRTDVNKATKVYKMLLSAGYIPQSSKLWKPTQKGQYQSNDRAEECFPIIGRKGLYHEIQTYYEQQQVDTDLRFVISLPDDASMYNKVPTPLPSPPHSSVAASPEKEKRDGVQPGSQDDRDRVQSNSENEQDRTQSGSWEDRDRTQSSSRICIANLLNPEIETLENRMDLS